MSVIVLKPNRTTATYNEAANVFADMYKKVTGKDISIYEKDDGVSDLVVIGSDSVNDFLMNEIMELNIESLGIRYGTDDYCIRFCKKDNRNILILAGGRGRSTLYAIYGYFEKYLNCHYFWDGDVVPHSDGIPMQGVDIVESPRFQYRGLRYFAHRGLKRFQAEHWSFEDWKIEIDWMVKKRLNFFMLRIGMDDVWQRAFPEAVPYPDGYLKIEGVDADGYDDRSDFWTLKYRGELREKILEYARLLDLTYPTDCGTMTHWYSRTPLSYLENKKPKFTDQVSSDYSSSTGKVWDFMDKNEMDNYMKLTETMVNEYEKSTELFHTIGLGERRLFTDVKKNHTAKLIAYRRIAENIRERYPGSKLMVASWDFLGRWTGEEVQKLISELDPERTIILDYTSNHENPDKTFPNWGITGKFPWIFGLFHAYESESELRGNYDLSDERLKIAMNDEYCKGMILWPELSHSDPLVLEYLTRNAWSPLERNIEEITENFCKNRYGEYSAIMNECWQGILTFIKQRDWSGYRDMWPKLTRFLDKNEPGFQIIAENIIKNLESTLPLTENTVNSLRLLAQSGVDFENEFILRDSMDIVRTVLGRFLNFISAKLRVDYTNKTLIRTLKGHYMTILEIMADVLNLNDDFSLYKTLKYIESVAPVNPDFEITLKRNIYNFYCSQMAYELVEYIFKDECNMVFDKFITSDCAEMPDFSEEMKVITDKFMNTPLKEMQSAKELNPREVILKAAEAVEAVCKILQTK